MATIWAVNREDKLKGEQDKNDDVNLVWTACTAVANVAVCGLGCWRCFANNYLQWTAFATWILLSIQGSLSIFYRLNHVD